MAITVYELAGPDGRRFSPYCWRTRMALADGGELIVLAPSLVEFGEDRGIDQLIRKYGYFGTPHTLKMVEENEDLAKKVYDMAYDKVYDIAKAGSSKPSRKSSAKPARPSGGSKAATRPSKPTRTTPLSLPMRQRRKKLKR